MIYEFQNCWSHGSGTLFTPWCRWINQTGHFPFSACPHLQSVSTSFLWANQIMCFINFNWPIILLFGNCVCWRQNWCYAAHSNGYWSTQSMIKLWQPVCTREKSAHTPKHFAVSGSNMDSTQHVGQTSTNQSSVGVLIGNFWTWSWAVFVQNKIIQDPEQISHLHILAPFYPAATRTGGKRIGIGGYCVSLPLVENLVTL